MAECYSCLEPGHCNCPCDVCVRARERWLEPNRERWLEQNKAISNALGKELPNRPSQTGIITNITDPDDLFFLNRDEWKQLYEFFNNIGYIDEEKYPLIKPLIRVLRTRYNNDIG